MSSRFRLPYLLLIVISMSFVTLLAAFTDQLDRLWPLYGIPILAASVAYYASGAVLTGAIAVALAALLAADTGAAESLLTDIGVGLLTLIAVGVLMGRQAGRLERRAEVLEELCVEDTLTGLFTEMHFETRLAEEVRRIDRYGTTAALAYIDIDDLGAFNATFGTHRGDLLIAHMAEVLSVSVRDTDVLARMSGGAYAALLPYTDLDQASYALERIRKTVESTDFEGDELEPVTRHTISIGFTAYPHPAHTREDLVGRARAGLKAAKREGGNASVAGEPPAPPEPDAQSQAEGRVV